jgi:hypothetical protein
MKMLLSHFPEEIVQQYNINALAVDGWVYIEIRKGVYGLKQAGLLANQLLQTRLAPFGNYPARHTPGLWMNKRGQSLSRLSWTISQSRTWASSTRSIPETPYCELMS